MHLLLSLQICIKSNCGWNFVKVALASFSPLLHLQASCCEVLFIYRDPFFSSCVLRQVICATAGSLWPERGDQGNSGQQPAEWWSHPGCPVLGFPLAGPAGNSGSVGLHANSCHHRTRQVGWYRNAQTQATLQRLKAVNIYVSIFNALVILKAHK